MPIPESQLQTWSNQGVTVSSAYTYKAIRSALEDSGHLSGRDIDIYLQGSYANHTNIRGDSDVDIVAELQSSHYYNTDRLPDYQRQAYDRDHSSTDYGWDDFRQDVVRALSERFGSDVDASASRCVKVKGRSSRLPADVVVALEYRVYTRYVSLEDHHYISGIRFKDLSTAEWIINFPKLHRKNGSAKNDHSRTRNNYKPTIRMFKNARTRLVDARTISKEIAPSYFVECLLYNVPDQLFIGTFQERYCGILSWIQAKFQMYVAQGFTCQNEQSSLFGKESTQWNVDDAVTLVNCLASLWNSY